MEWRIKDLESDVRRLRAEVEALKTDLERRPRDDAQSNFACRLFRHDSRAFRRALARVRLDLRAAAVLDSC
jgi:hypothetical protein